MNLLTAAHYDPAVSVSKATTSLLAMTALDATNLRCTFTAPASGRVRVVIRGGAIHGATTFPQILVGCLENSPASGTVRGRQVPQGGGFNGTAVASTQLPVAVDYVLTGLTPAQQYVWDAAYGVEIVLASTGWKYGGPNNATTNDAWGGISFEIWDPSPIYTPSSGAPPTTPVSERIDTVDNFIDTEIADIQARLPAALVGGRMDASVGAMAAGVVTAAAVATGAIDADALAADAVTEIWAGSTAPTAAAIADAVWDEAIAGHLSAGSTGLALNSAGAAGDPWGTSLPGAYASGTAGNIIGNMIDAAISTRLASASYTAPDNSSITAILADTNELQADWANGGRLDLILDARASQTSVDAIGVSVDAILVDTSTTLQAELDGIQADTEDIQSRLPAALVGGRIDASVGAMAANVITAAATATDYVTEVQSGLATTAALTTVEGKVDIIDTVVDAIKAKTDSLAFTVAGQVDSNVKYVNDVQVTGNGQPGTEWGP